MNEALKVKYESDQISDYLEMKLSIKKIIMKKILCLCFCAIVSLNISCNSENISCNSDEALDPLPYNPDPEGGQCYAECDLGDGDEWVEIYCYFSYREEFAKLLQTALKQESFYSGCITGELDSDTEDAFREYQMANDLPVCLYDIDSLMALGILE